MKKLLFLLALVCFAPKVSAQTVTIIGPNSQLVWDMNSSTAGLTAAIAQGFTYAVTVDSSTTPITLMNVTCVAVTPVAPNLSENTCSTLLSQIPMGSHSITMTAATATVTSLPSTAFSFVTMLIPAPSGLFAR